ncbi:MAG: PIG-L family deacetylase [Bacillota bacterium]
MAQTILGVFPHPDDEISIAGLLYRAGEPGMKTHLICATRGEACRIRHPDIATAETIAEVRTVKMSNVSKLLGASSLSFLDLPDGKSDSWSSYDAEGNSPILYRREHNSVKISNFSGGTNPLLKPLNLSITACCYSDFNSFI